jgi:hypothetical protein
MIGMVLLLIASVAAVAAIVLRSESWLLGGVGFFVAATIQLVERGPDMLPVAMGAALFVALFGLLYRVFTDPLPHWEHEQLPGHFVRHS